eukprot:NODE_90_length_21577_cov_0.697691.p4 type:complete len:583 gc:universal NODE_90_length_21577_cov_0.697691:4837-6585(+)
MSNFFSIDVKFEKHSIIHIKDPTAKELHEDEIDKLIKRVDIEEELGGFVEDKKVTSVSNEFNRFFAWKGSGPIKMGKNIKGQSIEDIPPLRQISLEYDLNKPMKRIRTPEAPDSTEAPLKKLKVSQDSDHTVATPPSNKVVESKNKPKESLLQRPKKIAKKPVVKKKTNGDKIGKFMNSLKSDKLQLPPTEIQKVHNTSAPIPNESKIPLPPLDVQIDEKRNYAAKKNLQRPKGSLTPLLPKKKESPIKSMDQKTHKDKFEDLITIAELLEEFDFKYSNFSHMTVEIENAIDGLIKRLITSIYEIPSILFERLSSISAIPKESLSRYICDKSVQKFANSVESELQEALTLLERHLNSFAQNQKIKLSGEIRTVALKVVQGFLAFIYLKSCANCYENGVFVLYNDRKIRQNAIDEAFEYFKNHVERKRLQKLLSEEKRKYKNRFTDQDSLQNSSMNQDVEPSSPFKIMTGIKNANTSPSQLKNMQQPIAPFKSTATGHTLPVEKIASAHDEFGDNSSLPTFQQNISPLPPSTSNSHKILDEIDKYKKNAQQKPTQTLPPYAAFAVENLRKKKSKKPKIIDLTK